MLVNQNVKLLEYMLWKGTSELGCNTQCINLKQYLIKNSKNVRNKLFLHDKFDEKKLIIKLRSKMF